MALLTSQRISDLFNKYKNAEITFNKSVIAALGLVTKQVYLKCLGYQWPCVIYSSSMVSTKIIMNLSKDTLEIFRKANNLVSIRFSFIDPDKNVPVAFFVNCKIAGYTPYSKENPNLQFVSLKFVNQPPEDLISTLGLLVETNVNAKNRAEERLLLSDEIVKAMGLNTKASAIVIDGLPRPCILRDLSFSGVKVVISGLGKFLVNKAASVKIEFDDVPSMLIPGIVLRFDPVEGRKELSSLGIQFTEGSIPIQYKMKINDQLVKKKK